jgi:hypothetical protein
MSMFAGLLNHARDLSRSIWAFVGFFAMVRTPPHRVAPRGLFVRLNLGKSPPPRKAEKGCRAIEICDFSDAWRNCL